MKRAEAKTEFLELLRTDRKAARKCVKGKECGGRCIPQNWNCRLKGEGEVAPTRGNMVMRTPETEARVKKEQQARAAASRNSFLKSAALLGGAAAVGAALQRKGVKPEAMTSATTYAGGVASALNPALAGAATLISVGVAGGGAAAQNISRGIKSNATTSALSRRAKALELLKRGIDTRARKKKEQVIAERKSIEKLGEKITNATTDKARRTALAEMKTREKTLARMESELKKLQAGNKQRAARISRIQKRGYTSPVDVVKGASKTLKTAGKAGTRTQSTRQGVRRQFGLTGTGKSGPKVDPRSMIEKNLEDRADAFRKDAGVKRLGKPCGASHISKKHKCTKGAGTSRSEKPNTQTKADLSKWAALGVSAAAVGGIAAVLYSQNASKQKILKDLKSKQADARLRRTEEHDAIYTYVSASYGLNRALRSGNELTENMNVVKDGLDSWLKDAPTKKGIYYRGMGWEVKSDWSTVKEGQTLTDKAFGSFTSDRKVGMKFGRGKEDTPGVVIVARGALSQLPYHVKGRYGQEFGETLRKEKEFLTKRNTQFKVRRTQDITLRFSRKRGSDELIRDPKGDIVRKQRFVYVDLVEPERTDSVAYRGETFAGYNKPKRTPNHPKKSHAVLAKENGRVKLIRFGQQGVKGSPKKKGESASYAARRRSFKARHAKNIAKGKMSAAYWANRSKW